MMHIKRKEIIPIPFQSPLPGQCKQRKEKTVYFCQFNFGSQQVRVLDLFTVAELLELVLCMLYYRCCTTNVFLNYWNTAMMSHKLWDYNIPLLHTFWWNTSHFKLTSFNKCHFNSDQYGFCFVHPGTNQLKWKCEVFTWQQ